MKYNIHDNRKNGFKQKITNDRFTLGFVSGLIAAVAMSILNYLIIYTTAANNRYADFVGIMLFGSKPDSAGEIFIASIAHILLGGILGSIFAYLVLVLSEKNLIMKGMIYGTLVFFLLFSLGVFFKIPGLQHTLLRTVITKSIGSAFYGFVLAYSYLVLTKDVK